ncbi:Cox20/FAM36A, partial [Trinorchestia longiramus]
DATLFGRRLSDIPCYRATFLTSSFSALGGTMAYFLFTSNMKNSLKCGMGVFTVVTIGYWCHCRYNYAKQKFHHARLQEAMKRNLLKDVDLGDR